MKNTAFKITATVIGIFFSLTACAQKTVATKLPELPAPVVQPAPENKTPVTAPVNDIKHETAVKQSSFSSPIPAKGNDKAEPAKVPEQKPLPETNKIVPPNRVKNR